MAKSVIQITFNSLPSVDERLVYSNDLSTIALFEEFKTLRTRIEQSTIGGTVNTCALNFYNAIYADYNNGGLYSITVALNVVTITAIQSNVTFTEVLNTTSGAVTAVITNNTEILPISITDIAFQQSVSTNYNKIIGISVTTSLLATSVSSPLVISPNADNPFVFDYARGSLIDVICTDGSDTATQSIQLPDVLRSSNVSVNIVNFPTGASATVLLSAKYGLTLEYSLDNSTWQTSNVFTGLLNDTYTVYIKDQYGGATTSDFVVSIFSPDISVTNSFAYVAPESAIRFKKNEIWDYCNIYKTDANTLSCEEDVDVKYKYTHKYQTCDTDIVVQFLSNYETLEANVIREDLTKDSLAISQRSTNIGAKDKRDAMYYNLENDQTGIYYVSGDTYNYSTGFKNGEYELFGELPNYGVKGNFIYLDDIGWFQIVDIIFDDDLDSDVLVIDYTYTGTPTEIVVSSEFNRKNYDVYEFNIDMSNYADEEIQIELLMSDSNFTDANYLSEKISVKERWEKTVEVIWYNPRDTFSFYSTGFKNKARLPYQLFTAGDDSSLEIHKTDTTTMMISSDSYDTKDLVLQFLPTAIKNQLTRAFLHKELYIDKVQYVATAPPETEPLGNSNTYRFSVNIQKTGNVFNSEWDGSGNSIEDVELIGLIQSDNTYIKQG